MANRTEPTDLVSNDWLGTDQFFAADNVEVSGGNLVLSVGEVLGHRVSNPLDVGAVNDVGSSVIDWAATEPTDTEVRVQAALTDSNWIGSLFFDGVDDYVDTGFPSDTITALPFTQSCWFYSTEASPGSNVINARIMSMFSGTTGTRNSFGEDGGFLRVNNSGTTEVLNIAIDINRWYLATVVWDVNETRLYLDGVLVKSSAALGSLAMTANVMRIGSYSTNQRLFKGFLHGARIYNKALSAAEITDLYNGKNVTSNLLGSWKLDEGAGSVAGDSAGAYSGSVNGATWTKGESGLWQPATKEAAIPGVGAEDDLTGKYLWVRQELARDTTGTTSPSLESLEYSVTQASAGEEIALVGSAEVVTGAAGLLGIGKVLSGAGAAETVAEGTLLVVRGLAGDGGIDVIAEGMLQAWRKLAGDVGISFSATGALSVVTPGMESLVGTAGVTTEMGGLLKVRRGLSGAVVVDSQALGVLTVESQTVEALQGVAQVSTKAEGMLRAWRKLAGAVVIITEAQLGRGDVVLAPKRAVIFGPSNRAKIRG